MPSALAYLSNRFRSRIRRVISEYSARRLHPLHLDRPLISFTFDDFPKSASTVGGAILARYGVHATYYVSLGLKDRVEPSGLMFDSEQLGRVVADGHELGCHTFDHLHAWNTAKEHFATSLDENQKALRHYFPHVLFETMSYPISEPNPGVKRAAAKRFSGCRGGGQTFNSGFLDRNSLNAYFLEKSGGTIDPVRNLILRNRRAKGWLIFATHDVCPEPTRYGVVPEFFEQVVHYSVASGATIVPVSQALRMVGARSEARD